MSAAGLIATRVFRAMLRAADGRPSCGDRDAMLGVRVSIDVKVDPGGRVQPARGGMSVTPDDPVQLPPHFRPIALGGLGKLPVFGIELSLLGAELSYRPDPKKPLRHGFVEPAVAMRLVDYQAALAATAAAWQELV